MSDTHVTQSLFHRLLCELYILNSKKKLNWYLCELETSFGIYYFREFSTLDEFKLKLVNSVTSLKIHVTPDVIIDIKPNSLESFDILYVTEKLLLEFPEGRTVVISYSY